MVAVTAWQRLSMRTPYVSTRAHPRQPTATLTHGNSLIVCHPAAACNGDNSAQAEGHKGDYGSLRCRDRGRGGRGVLTEVQQRRVELLLGEP